VSVISYLEYAVVIFVYFYIEFNLNFILQIMDPKMDSGMTTCGYNSVEEAIESGAAPVKLHLLQIIDVMDHLLACEVLSV
jgi:hypothetical protein